MTQRTTLVIASGNRAKILEFRELLRDLPLDVVGTGDVLTEKITVVEDGATFEQNALKKAKAVAEAAMMLTLADDSGLEWTRWAAAQACVRPALPTKGRPMRKTTPLCSTALAEVEEEQRQAQFHCVLVLINPWAPPGTEPFVVEGRCYGAMAREPRGAGGFGYNPLFIVQSKGRTMAELTDEEKNSVSHRARAVDLLRPTLAALLQARLQEAARLSR